MEIELIKFDELLFITDEPIVSFNDLQVTFVLNTRSIGVDIPMSDYS